MASSIWLWMLLVSSGLMGSLEAYEFKVGGNQGWVLNPSENYNLWASRMRFQVNDTIFFKYNKGTDSVLVVNKQDYDTCNTQNPIMKMDGGDSVFKFDRSGPFYFISGNKDNCDKGQKLIVVVLAVRNLKKPTPPGTPPAESPVPAGKTPATSPATAPSPVGKTPASSPTPGSSYPATTPAKSPATSPVSPSPATSPSNSPATSPESPSPATAESSPPASSTLSPGTTPAESDIAPNPSGNTAEASAGTPPRPSSSPAFIPPVFMVLLATLLSSVAMGSFVASPWDNMGIF